MKTDWVFRAIMVTAVVLLAAFLYAVIAETTQWIKFKEEHNCKVISKESGSTAVAIGPNGQVITVIGSGKTSYQCDDGVIYVR